MELEFKMQEWTYRTLPNKMYELVHNTGDLNKKGTGYLTDAESEMLTIINYLNFDEKTGITESMIAQIDKAIRESANQGLHEDYGEACMSDNMDSSGKKSGGADYSNVKVVATYMPVEEFAEAMTEIADQKIGAIYYRESGENAGYTVNYYWAKDDVSSTKFNTIIECRKYLEQLGCTIRMPNRSKDPDLIETWF